MRLLELDLERYGPFTGKRLAFRPDAKLHIVYGPNEAGKSCSLAAVTDLFFGIETRTRFDFVHAGRDLRIGATIADRAGRTLAFRRRKNKPLLIGKDDAALPDDSLAPFLGGLTREVFCRAFGLDADALRASGKDLQKSDGELGSALFSAASGLRGLNDLRAALDKEADGIFAQRASKDRTFYQGLNRYEDARAALREREFRSGALKKLRDGIEEQSRAHEVTRARRVEIATEKSRLERIRRSAPIVRLIDAAEADLAALGPLPGVPEGFSGELSAALETLATSRTRSETAIRAEAQLLAAQAGLAPDTAVLAHADEIERLSTQSGAWLKARADLPGVQREADGFTADLAALAIRLGLPDADAVLARQPSDADRARLEALLDEAAKRDAKLAAADTKLATERLDLASQQREREGRGPLRDPRPLRERLAALAGALKRIEAADELAVEAAAERRSLAEASARLSPGIADLDALASIALPSRETIAAARQRLDGFDADIRHRTASLAALQRDIAALQGRLAELDAGRPVPSAERIAASRTARDEAWTGLRAGLLGEAPGLSAGQLAGAILSLESNTALADRLADEAIADASRVAGHALAVRNLAAKQAEHADQARELEAVKADCAKANAGWQALWANAGIKPLAPAEMLGWLGQVDMLLDRRGKLLARQAQIDSAAQDATAIDAPLAALADEVGLPPVAGLSATARAGRLNAEIQRIAESWDAARDAETRLADTARRVVEAEASVASARHELADWQDRFRLATPAIGLGETATPVEAREALKAWKEVPACLKELRDRTRRAQGIRRDLQDFEAAVGALVGAAATDLAGLSPEAAVSTLKQRLAKARETHTRREEMEKQVATARTEIESASAALARAGQAVTALAASASLRSEGSAPGEIAADDLAALARQLAARDALRKALRDRREQLVLAADGLDEAVLRTALATHDPDASDAAIAELAEEDQRLDTEGKETFSSLRDLERQLASLEDGVGAELALQQRRNAEAEIILEARNWAVLSLGAMMIGEAIERQRANRQEPLMTRAGTLFSTLTGGDFTGLGQSFDDHDVPHLIGRRAPGRGIGEEVGVTDMSEGTRDQLYLALRLAYLEDYAARAEPAPFIGDDLFATFDDRRTENGLAALAAIGATVQPILFTHHRYVVDAAERHLGGDVDVVSL